MMLIGNKTRSHFICIVFEQVKFLFNFFKRNKATIVYRSREWNLWGVRKCEKKVKVSGVCILESSTPSNNENRHICLVWKHNEDLIKMKWKCYFRKHRLIDWLLIHISWPVLTSSQGTNALKFHWVILIHEDKSHPIRMSVYIMFHVLSFITTPTAGVTQVQTM